MEKVLNFCGAVFDEIWLYFYIIEGMIEWQGKQ
nr:MAG TPA: hypothetical protein [Caudoviricetes sp.]